MRHKSSRETLTAHVKQPDSAKRERPEKPNIVLIMADNLGWGELGCYGGGALRGAPTPRIDALAKEGLLLQNYNVESDCVPTRSALMTGRHPIRTGCTQSVPAGLPQGLDPSEITLAELLKGQGYRTAHYGKWHLGDVPGRFPSDRGFEHWKGIPRTSDETMFMDSQGFDPSSVELPYIMEGFEGEPSRNVLLYDIPARKTIDSDLVDLSIEFINTHAHAKQPFFLYLPLIHLHFPTLPHPDFQGRTGNGNFADSIVELDYRVGQVYDCVKEAGIEDDTVFIFCSDNGPEFRIPYRGTAGPWTGTYHTAMEGSLRVPFILRWPGRVPAGVVSNEIVHCVDIFTTLAHIGGATLPDDRLYDGVDQLAFFTQKQACSNREGFLFYIKSELRAIKWRHYKLHFYNQPQVDSLLSPGKLESPLIFNLITDPKEEVDVATEQHWMVGAMMRMKEAFWERPGAKAPPPRMQPLPPAPAAGYEVGERCRE
ncbi:hypothetical protein L202_03335 [Cryptococcus amylolentus CBS 6039]|uniref:Sulfatase N-terminal domain-containing protein n=1 Tax=Cryptococcus amylolentus CBS 6039 TaxID=1295533 RepID=A0A1E3HSL4_9TREE|nr:hypothetical protein L202_03335 [Cryptococcus amylolentus CBS 6039]ODN79327.1 hypothetical protein L202_03335 [Cryptococcus amylolentus CBS 6039]